MKEAYNEGVGNGSKDIVFRNHVVNLSDSDNFGLLKRLDSDIVTRRLVFAKTHSTETT